MRSLALTGGGALAGSGFLPAAATAAAGANVDGRVVAAAAVDQVVAVALEVAAVLHVQHDVEVARRAAGLGRASGPRPRSIISGL